MEVLPQNAIRHWRARHAPAPLAHPVPTPRHERPVHMNRALGPPADGNPADRLHQHPNRRPLPAATRMLHATAA
jgi:hypothetical protein